MIDHDILTGLRGLVNSDPAGLVRFLSTKPWPEDCLQLIGDGLLTATAVDGWVPVAERCVGAHRDRAWRGDPELADALAGGLGAKSGPTLKVLTLSLEELGEVLEGDPMHGGGVIDLRTGIVWPQQSIDAGVLDEEEEEEDFEDPEVWLPVDCEGSRDSYRDMERYIGSLDDEAFVEKLNRAIEGRGAFRRFHDRLYDRPELIAPWLAYSDDRHRGRAREWLAREGYEARPRLSGTIS